MADPVTCLEFDPRIRLPAHALFVGASMSGKTRLVLHLLSKPELFHPLPKTIIFCYDQYQEAYRDVKTALGRDQQVDFQLIRGHDVTLDTLPHHDHQTLLIIDDASEETAASPEIARIATNGRHKNISLWLIWHSLFTRHPTSRIISQNMGLYFLLPSLRLESQLRTLGSQLGMKNRLINAYKFCAEHDNECDQRYLMLDLSPSVPTLLRLRSHIHQPVQYCYP